MLRKIIGTVCVSMAVLFSTSCIMVNNNGNSGDIDYTDYSGDNMLVIVKNDSTKNVVCFTNTPSEATLLSGAKAGRKTGIKKDTSFGKGSFDFVLFCVTEEDYLKYDYSELVNRPFARLYAIYNADAESRTNLVYTISENLGGDYYFNLQNSTQYNCEIREGGLYGNPLMYAGAYTNNTKVYAQAGEYNLYPVFRKFDKYSESIITNYPKTSKGNPYYLPIALQSGEEAAELDCSMFIANTDDFKISPSAAYLKIRNDNPGLVKLYKGATATASNADDGSIGVNSGKSKVYTIDLDKISADEYEEDITISSWKVGSASYKQPIPENTYLAGYRYTLNCKGDSSDALTVAFKLDAYGNIAKDYIDLDSIEDTVK